MNHAPKYLEIALIAVGLFASIPASAAKEGDLCKIIRDRANTGHLQEFVLDKMTNVPFGQQRIDLVTGESGTAHVPYVEAFDTHTHAPVDISDLYDGADYWGGDHLGLIVYNNMVQILYYNKDRYILSHVPLPSVLKSLKEEYYQDSVQPSTNVDLKGLDVLFLF